MENNIVPEASKYTACSLKVSGTVSSFLFCCGRKEVHSDGSLQTLWEAHASKTSAESLFP